MNITKHILLLLFLAINAIDYCQAQVTLPLYPNSKVVTIKKRLTVTKTKATNPKDAFQNSIVYDTMELLKRSERGKKLIKTMKRLRLVHLRNVNNNHKNRLGRTLKKQDKKLHSHFPLFQGFGSHYVSAWIGTPSQRVTLLVDTGSHMTAFPCKGCTDCGDAHTDPPFDQEESSTFQTVSCSECSNGGSCTDDQCITTANYLEGSYWSGYQATDDFFLGNNENQDVGNTLKNTFTFVCQTSETGLFQTQLENGIIGLQDASMNMYLPKLLHNAKKIPENQFSLCLQGKRFTSLDGFHAGLMTIGGIDSSYHSSPMMYAQSGVGYDVTIRSMYLLKSSSGSKKQQRKLADYIQVPILAEQTSYGGSHTVDSGTTITYFSPQFASGFKKEWKLLTGFDYNSNDDEAAYAFTDEQFSKLPTILVQLEGRDENQTTKQIGRKLDSAHGNDVMLSFPPSHYLFKEGDDYYINFSFVDQGINKGILGANIMQGHDVLFDQDKSRIGFADSTCVYKSA